MWLASDTPPIWPGDKGLENSRLIPFHHQTHAPRRVTWGCFWPHPGQLSPANWPVNRHPDMSELNNMKIFHSLFTNAESIAPSGPGYLAFEPCPRAWLPVWQLHCASPRLPPPQYQPVSALRITRPSSLYQSVFSARSTSQPVRQAPCSEVKWGVLYTAAPRAPNTEYKVTIIFGKNN